jgi:hypothetical protein
LKIIFFGRLALTLQRAGKFHSSVMKDVIAAEAQITSDVQNSTAILAKVVRKDFW